VGAHKTGSSAIQRSLRHYDDGEAIYASFPSSNHSKFMVTIFSAIADRYHGWTKEGATAEHIQSEKERYLEILEKDLKNKKRNTLIISAEDASSFSENDIKAMDAYFADNGLKLEVVFYYRDPIDYVASAVQEKVKGGAKVIQLFSPDYSTRISNFTKALSKDKIKVLNYNEEVKKHGEVVASFSDLCGLKDVTVTSSNISISEAALKLLFCLNHTCTLMFGTPDRKNAWQRTRQVIFRAYPVKTENDKIKKNILKMFAADSIQEDINFLNSNFNSQFKNVDKGVSDIDPYDYLNDFENVDLSPLYTYLEQSFGVDITGDETAAETINMIFHINYYLRSDSMTFRVIRDVALNISNGKAGPKDAEKLFRRALNFRPNSPVSKEFLAHKKKQKLQAQQESAEKLKQDVQRDNLKLIKGIGPKYEKGLNAVGVHSFCQIASWKASDLKKLDEKISGISDRAVRGKWKDQAATLAKRGS